MITKCANYNKCKQLIEYKRHLPLDHNKNKFCGWNCVFDSLKKETQNNNEICNIKTKKINAGEIKYAKK